jgi:hypothetical protein
MGRLPSIRINLSPVKTKIVKIILKNPQYFTITNTSWLMLFREAVPVYTENHTKTINTK